MFVRVPVSCVWIATLVGLTFVAGCGKASPPPSAPAKSPGAESGTDDYNPHDVPITEDQKKQLREQVAQFPKAIEVIRQLRSTVEEETKNGIPQNPYKAHQGLDKADLVLQWLPEIARDSAVPKEHWEGINTTANDLRTLFEKVHQNIDNKQEPDFASVAGEIDQKIQALAQIAVTPPAEKGEPQP